MLSENCGMSCQNRGQRIRCDPSNCRLGSQCSNQAPAHGMFPRHEVFQTHDSDGKRGNGFMLLEEVPAGAITDEYTGDIVEPHQAGNQR
ncbi:hypothetical protein V8F33_009041 [Rhypophila sp. PSN 637]